MSKLVPLNLYCCVGIPPIVSLACGLPTNCSFGKLAFNTVENCSCQLSFVKSFHSIGVFARFCPFASNTVSVVETDSIFKYPDDAIFLFGWYDISLANLNTDSLRSARSIKFSLAFKSTLYDIDCPTYAIKSISAMNSEESIKSLNDSA